MWRHKEFLYPFEERHRSNLQQAPEKAIRKALERVNDWSCAIDGGAHVGVVSRYLAEKFKRVVAIEIAPDTAKCLRRNTADLINVEILTAALGEKSGLVGYEGDQAEDSTVRCVAEGDSVDMITIDSLELPSCGFIKLDLQGYDYLALRGAEKTLADHRPVVVFEHKRFRRYGVDPDEPFSFLRALGYATERKGLNIICYEA